MTKENAPKPTADVNHVVTAEEAGRPIDGVLRALLGVSWGDARALIERGKVSLDGVRVQDGRTRVRVDARLEVRPTARRVESHPRGTLDDSAIAHCDSHLVVVRKPAGISTVPYDDSETVHLEDRLQRWLVANARQQPHASLGVVHRIDKETSGLVVFARTLAAKKLLTAAFRTHDIERRYVAVCHGELTSKRTYRSYLMQDRGDNLRGSAKDESVGKAAGQLSITHVAPVMPLATGENPSTLIVCRLETGRTHQIRIHMSEARMPIVGDRVYTRDRLRANLPLLDAPRLMLHAIVLGFSHPISGERLRFSDPIPADFRKLIAAHAGRPIEVDPDALPL